MPTDYCEKGFRQVEQILDEALAQLRSRISDITIVDNYNSSGSEKSGFPYFLWEVVLERKTEPRPYVSRAAVKISYLQPLSADDPCEVELTFIAEKYIIGAQSFFKKMASKKLPARALTVKDVCDACTALLAKAEHTVAESDLEK